MNIIEVNIMLSKTQKIWVWIFGAMFVVPEVLWGDLLRVMHIPFIPVFENSEFFASNPLIAYIIIIIEICGLGGLIYFINKYNGSLKLKLLLNIILVLLLIFLFLSLALSVAVNNMQLL